MRRATAAASGSASSFALTSDVTDTASASRRGDAAALQERDEEHADGGEVEDGLRAGGHAAGAEHGAELQDEVPDVLLGLQAVAHGGDGVDAEPLDVELVDDVRE